MEKENFLVADGLKKSFNKKTVLAGVSFGADLGEIVAVAGVNGSGKSTLLSVLSTLLSPDSGTVCYNGLDAYKNKESVLKFLAYVPQANALFDDLTVKDNINFWCSAFGKEFDYSVLEVCKIDCKKKVFQLSGGMKKLLNIYISLINEPQCLLLDEPTESLDILNKSMIWGLIEQLRQKNVLVIVSTHNSAELRRCDKICVLKNGIVSYYGKPNEIPKKDSCVSCGDSFTENLIELIGGNTIV